MLNELKVSVIMPAYNAEKHIGESIESVLNQTYLNWELIIVDDGSTDKTALVVEQYLKTDPRIKYFHQDRGRQGKARNLAINKSTGYYIAFLDADDIWVANKLEVQLSILNTRPDIDLICSQGYSFGEDNTRSYFYATVKEWEITDSESFIKSNQVAILSAVVKKSAIIDVGLFTENIAIQNVEDYHLWLKLLHKGYRFLTIPNFLFYYRIHELQSTHNGIDNFKLLNCYLDLIETKVIDCSSNALRTQVKWMIFKYSDFNDLLKKMKIVFPEKQWILSIFIAIQKLIANNSLIKKAVFHAL